MLGFAGTACVAGIVHQLSWKCHCLLWKKYEHITTFNRQIIELYLGPLPEGSSGRSMVAFNEIGHLAVFFFPLSRWWYPKIQWFQNIIFPPFSPFSDTPPFSDVPSEKMIQNLVPGRSAEVSCWYIHNFAALALRGVPPKHRGSLRWHECLILPGCQNGQPKWLHGVIWCYMILYDVLCCPFF